jgi:ABC-type multidrug transport system ATPase subunit
LTFLKANNIGKKFGNRWIFKNVNLHLVGGDMLAITGANGSGKSTLLQILAGYVSSTEGRTESSVDEKIIDAENIFHYIGFAAPYMDLMEEYTLRELFEFYFSFKSIANNKSVDDLIEVSGLEHSSEKFIKEFSSGMKQRAKLTLALSGNTHFVFLDEPVSNLDKQAVEWYKKLLQQSSQNKIVIICSNTLQDETALCNKTISIEDFK